MIAILFGTTIPTDQIAVAAIALITAALLFNVKKYFARQSMAQNGIKPGEEAKYLTAREIAQKNAQIKPEPTFTGAYKPEKIAQWEVEFFELTRQMTAQIDMKMSALSVLSQDATRVCQRMETLLERLEKTMVDQTETTEKSPVNPIARPLSSQSPLAAGENTNRFRNPHDFSPGSPLHSPLSLASSLSPASSFASLESVEKKKTLFPRLSSLGSLEFSDNDDLAALGADLFAEDPLEPKTFHQARETNNFPEKPGLGNSSLMGRQSMRPFQEHKPQYPSPAGPSPGDRTLGELLLQEKHQNQAAKQQSVPSAPSTLQPTPTIESIFKPMESRPSGVRPVSQIIPREKVGG